jgi:branched-chain amino acid transport system permease protein
MFLGAVVAVAFGLIIGYPTLRLRGPYFALCTLAFAQILMTYIINTDHLGPINLRGALGLVLPLRNSGNAPELFQFASKTPYYFIALAMLIGVLLLSYAIGRSRLGFYWAAIRGDQDAAESLGIDAPRYRLLAVIISVALTAIAGTFYTQYFFYINAERGLGLHLSVEIVLIGVVGGWQTVLGPLMGAIVLTPIGEIVRAQFGGGLPGLHLILYGLLLMAVILWLPGGLNDPAMRLLHWLEVRIWERPHQPSKPPAPAEAVAENAQSRQVR